MHYANMRYLCTLTSDGFAELTLSFTICPLLRSDMRSGGKCDRFSVNKRFLCSLNTENVTWLEAMELFTATF